MIPSFLDPYGFFIGFSFVFIFWRTFYDSLYLLNLYLSEHVIFLSLLIHLRDMAGQRAPVENHREFSSQSGSLSFLCGFLISFGSFLESSLYLSSKISHLYALVSFYSFCWVVLWSLSIWRLIFFQHFKKFLTFSEHSFIRAYSSYFHVLGNFIR